MKTTRRTFLSTLAIALSLAVTGVTAAIAKTPDNMLVIAHRIDDITSLDPAESFEIHRRLTSVATSI